MLDKTLFCKALPDKGVLSVRKNDNVSALGFYGPNGYLGLSSGYHIPGP